MSFTGAIRRRILTPGISATRLDVRGFHVKDESARQLLETVGESFLTGYGYAAEVGVPSEAERRLEGVPERFRGFAYEGAAMCFAIRDGLPLSRGGWVARFLAGRADAHIYMAYVGVGWAMARLPRMRWSTLHAPDRLLRWLALDGYGFHQAYFKTKQYVHEQYREDRFPWPSDGYRWYSPRAIDQGIGRAMWFVGGADAMKVTEMIRAFDPRRQPDLYAGAGLAATYAGGADEEELRAFWEGAGPYRPQVAQGAAFAAGARGRAGLVMPHNEVATRVFCEMSVAEARKVTDDALIDLPEDGDVPSFEAWRRRIAEKLVSLRQC